MHTRADLVCRLNASHLRAAWLQRAPDSLAHLEKHFYTAAAVLQKVCIVLDTSTLEQQNCSAAAELEEAEFIALHKQLLQGVRVHNGSHESGADANKRNLVKNANEKDTEIK